jgi:hypothetical protein
MSGPLVWRCAAPSALLSAESVFPHGTSDPQMAATGSVGDRHESSKREKSNGQAGE